MADTDFQKTKSTHRTTTGRALPLVAIAGTRGKSTIAWLLESILSEANWSTGIWSTTGVYVDGMRQAGELGPWSRVIEAARNGALDVAVQELETALVTGVGLPAQIYPLAAISTLCGNNDECLISDQAAQGARAQTIVARAVRPDGRLILNADDQAVLNAAEHTEAEIVLFSIHRDNPAMRRHLEAGRFGVWTADGYVVAGNETSHRSVVSVEEAAFTLDGALIFQVQNLLCAVAMALVLGLPDEAIRAGARQFRPDPDRLPGRCNIVHTGGATMLVDSAEQVWTLRTLVRGVRHQPHRRTIIVSGTFPHVPESQTLDAGRLLGRLGGAVILHADEDHRSRLDQIIEGIAQNEIPPLVLSMPSEAKAIEHAIRMLGDGDLCLLITSDIQNAFAAISSHTAE